MAGKMQLDPDFREFIECCLAREVEFLIVGGYAMAAHGHPRYTKDLDVWLLVDPTNAQRLLDALDDFGFGSVGLTANDFTAPGQVVQLGYPPKRIDLLTSIDGVDFSRCFAERVDVAVHGLDQPVPFIDAANLERNKLAAARPQDLADVDALRRPQT